MEKKVAIIGMGNVGSTIAYTVLLKNVCSRLIVTDKNEKLSHAQLLDLQHAAVLMNRDIQNLEMLIWSFLQQQHL